MKNYSNVITLEKNHRGVYILDPLKGCKAGTIENVKGCFGDCYAALAAQRYGFNFGEVIKRDFESKKTKLKILNKIAHIDARFIRMGNSCDPSENWEHTISICEEIKNSIDFRQLNLFNSVKPKQIVIITKHFNTIEHGLIDRLQRLNICINTSVSAIDSSNDLNKKIGQYERLKSYCESVLRVVTFNFNLENERGKYYNEIQDWLLKYPKVIETVFRPTKNNKLIDSGIIKVQNEKFIKSKILMSKRKKGIFTGMCYDCLEQCGIRL